MNKKFVLAAISLAAVLAVAAYVFLTDQLAGRQAPAESAPVPKPASSGGLPDTEPARAAQKSSASATLTTKEHSPERESKRQGDLTVFSMSYGDIGYVDVNSILQDRDPYSVVHLLQAHSDLTGADDSLEIRIDRISENKSRKWGHEVLFTQLIEGQPTNEGGRVFFTSSGAVTWVYGDIINPQALAGDSVLILSAEAEARAYEAAVRYSATLEPNEHPEWRDRPWEITVGSAVMRHELDSDYELVRLWRVPVSLDGPAATGIRVSVSPVTGNVISVRSAVVQSSSQTKFILCDASKIKRTARKCDLSGSKKSPKLVMVEGDCKLTPKSECDALKYTVSLETVGMS